MLIELHDCLDILLRYETEPECQTLLSEFVNNGCNH